MATMTENVATIRSIMLCNEKCKEEIWNNKGKTMRSIKCFRSGFTNQNEKLIAELEAALVGENFKIKLTNDAIIVQLPF